MPYNTTKIADTASKNPFLKATIPTSETDYEALNKRIQLMAANIREPVIPNIPSPRDTMKMADPQGSYRNVGGARIYNKDQVSPVQQEALAARENLLAEAEALKRRAEMQATGLEMKGAQAISSMQRADAALQRHLEQSSASSAAWEQAVEQADEYVQASNQRMAAIMGKLDASIAEVGRNLDFAKTQAVQTQVAGAISEMATEERNIVGQYGRNSPEHTQFLASKARSMHTAISNIHAQYNTLSAQLDAQLAMGRAEMGARMSTLVNYQEKTHIETMQAAAAAKSQYALQEVELALRVEQFKALQMDDLVTSLTGASIFRLDTLPFLQYLAGLAEGAQLEAETARQKEMALRGGTGPVQVVGASQTANRTKSNSASGPKTKA